MNTSDIYWVGGIEPRRLAFGPRPRSGDWLGDEVGAWASQGIKHVVSLLEVSESYELGLLEEENECEKHGIRFLAFPIPDRDLPASMADTHALIAKIVSFVRGGEPVYVHCRMGIGRSALVTASVILHLGVKVEAAFPLLCVTRGLQLPDTQAQVDWVESYSKRYSGAL